MNRPVASLRNVHPLFLVVCGIPLSYQDVPLRQALGNLATVRLRLLRWWPHSRVTWWHAPAVTRRNGH